jgi:hypothetical protein
MTQKTFGVDYKCENCFFSIQTRANPTDINPAIFCKWGPPEVGLTPLGNGAVDVRTFPRPVVPNDWCFQYRPKQSAVKVPDVNTPVESEA